jgi:hypothetical protein
MTNEELQEILSKPTTSITKAGEALGFGKNEAYDAAANGTIPVIKIGAGKRDKRTVSTAWLRRQLQLEGAA